jgi:tyrosyl-tRNA synthetase
LLSTFALADTLNADTERALFSGSGNLDNMPSYTLSKDDLTDGKIAVNDILFKAGMTKSKGEGRRLIEQGGVSVNDKKVASAVETVCADDFSDGSIIVKKGKKVFYKIILE